MNRSRFFLSGHYTDR